MVESYIRSGTKKWEEQLSSQLLVIIQKGLIFGMFIQILKLNMGQKIQLEIYLIGALI